MSRRASHATRSRQTSESRVVPAPVKGLNAFDSIAEMDPSDAVILDNWFCYPTDVRVRAGYTDWATVASGVVNTTMSYSAPIAGNSKLFAAASTAIYDITAGGAGTQVLAGLSSDRLVKVMFGVSANYMICVNGADLPPIFDGTFWGNIFAAAFNTTVTSITSVGTLATCTMANPHNLKTGMAVVIAGFTPAGYNGTYVITVTGASTFTYVLAGALGVVTVTGTVTPKVNFAITGVNPSTFAFITMWKQRLFCVQKDTLSAWYLPSLNIGGAASQLDFSQVFKKGGSLLAVVDWSLDGGIGIDDYVAFITTEGEVAVYKGTDPAVAANWGLVGIYQIGQPIGRNCTMQLAGDDLIIARDGVVPLSKMILAAESDDSAAITNRIRTLMMEYAGSYNALDGWQMILYPAQNALIVNVPVGVGASLQSVQLVMNTVTGAWSRFTGWNAACFERHKGDLYFGTTTAVKKAWVGTADGSTQIAFEALQAFDTMDSAAGKQVNMVKFVVSTDGTFGLVVGVNADYDVSPPTGTPTFTPVVQSNWDSANWGGANWGGDLSVQRDWQTCTAFGVALAAHLTGAISGSQLRWMATEYLITKGSVLA